MSQSSIQESAHEIKETKESTGSIIGLLPHLEGLMTSQTLDKKHIIQVDEFGRPLAPASTSTLTETGEKESKTSKEKETNQESKETKKETKETKEPVKKAVADALSKEDEEKVKSTDWYLECSHPKTDLKKIVIRCERELEDLRRCLPVNQSWPTSDIQMRTSHPTKDVSDIDIQSTKEKKEETTSATSIMKRSVWIWSWCEALRLQAHAYFKLQLYYLTLQNLCLLPDSHVTKDDLLKTIICQKKIGYTEHLAQTYRMLILKDPDNLTKWTEQSVRELALEKERHDYLHRNVKQDKKLMAKADARTITREEALLMNQHWLEYLRSQPYVIPWIGFGFHDLTGKTLAIGPGTMDYLTRKGIEIKEIEPGQGQWRCFATRDFQKGEEIFCENPFIYYSDSTDHCSYCAKPIKTDNRKRCRRHKKSASCARIFYCSTKCESEAWNHYHGAICGFNTDPLESQVGEYIKNTPTAKIDIYCILKIIGMLLRSPHFPCSLFRLPDWFIQSMLSSLSRRYDSRALKTPLMTTTASSSTTTTTSMGIATATDTSTTTATATATATPTQTSSVSTTSTASNGDLWMQKDAFLYSYMEFIISTIYPSLSQGGIDELFLFNAHFFSTAMALMKRFGFILHTIETKNSKVPFGKGVYRILSLIQHQCLPNAIAEYSIPTEGNLMSIRSIGVLKKGQEITISLTPINMLGSVEDRSRLLDEFGITCHCSVCTTQRQPLAQKPQPQKQKQKPSTRSRSKPNKLRILEHGTKNQKS